MRDARAGSGAGGDGVEVRTAELKVRSTISYDDLERILATGNLSAFVGVGTSMEARLPG
jgi:hypothetical protein